MDKATQPNLTNVESKGGVELNLLKPCSVFLAVVLAIGCPVQSTACVNLQRRPVMFVHGSGLSPDSWNEMVESFRKHGYPTSHLLAVRLVPNDASNPRSAERFISPAVKELLLTATRASERAGCRAPTKVDIVAHSMGSVSSRWYASQIDATRVRNLVGITPANHGTDALCGHAGEGNQELCPAFAQSPLESAVQVALNGNLRQPADKTPFGFGSDRSGVPRIDPTQDRGIFYWTIRIEPDEWIRPASSAELDGAGGRSVPRLPAGSTETSPGNILWRSGVTHDDMPRDPQVISFVLRLLLADPS